MSEPSATTPSSGTPSYWEFIEQTQRSIAERVPDADLDANLTVLALNRASQAVTYDLEATLLRPRGWSWTTYRLMFVLWNLGEVEPSNLARLTGMTRAAVSNMVKGLVDKGWATRRTSAQDGRGVILSITDEGRATFEEIFRQHNQREAQWAELLTPVERQVLLSLLQKLLVDSATLSPRLRYEPPKSAPRSATEG